MSNVAGSIMGFQIPVGIKSRKKKVDEMLSLVESIDEGSVLLYFSSLNEESSKIVENLLDERNYSKIVEMMGSMNHEHALRTLIKKKIREVVRKKPGGGGYVLYSPNRGKKKEPKAVGTFPTKMGAKAAELQRFPPEDPKKLSKLRKQIDKMRKDPQKAAEKEREERMKVKPKTKKHKIKPHVKKKHESVKLLFKNMIRESLFRESNVETSQWQEYISRLSKQAVLSDKKLQSLEKSIVKQSESAISDAVRKLSSILKKSKFVVKAGQVSKDNTKQKTFMSFTVVDKEGSADVGPFYVFVEDGVMKLEISDTARSNMTKLDPERSKMLKGELVSFEEDFLESNDSIKNSVKKRDSYLSSMQTSLDEYVAELSALEISMLKNLLVKKYRKIN